MTSVPVSLGLDFGTESVRAILVDASGKQRGLASSPYASGQITDSLPGSGDPLPPRYALQDPSDWVESAIEATRLAIIEADVNSEEIVGIGVDFTSCTMLPTTRQGVPLCQLDSLRSVPLAWPKLWKHHGALEQNRKDEQCSGSKTGNLSDSLRRHHRIRVVFPEDLGDGRTAPGDRRSGGSLVRGRGLVCLATRWWGSRDFDAVDLPSRLQGNVVSRRRLSLAKTILPRSIPIWPTWLPIDFRA